MKGEFLIKKKMLMESYDLEQTEKIHQTFKICQVGYQAIFGEEILYKYNHRYEYTIISLLENSLVLSLDATRFKNLFPPYVLRKFRTNYEIKVK
jgi:hypothetical protein